MSILEVENVSKSFGGVKANVDISMNVEKGKIVGLIGPNGSGKTTTIAKLANQFKKNNKNVLMVAADTFRAAAVEQLSEWSSRIGTDIIKDVDGSDPASIVLNQLNKQSKITMMLLLLIQLADYRTNKI